MMIVNKRKLMLLSIGIGGLLFLTSLYALLQSSPTQAAPPGSPAKSSAFQIEVSEPVIPHLTGNVRDLPRAEAWQPGDPVLEIPRLTREPEAVPNKASEDVDVDPLLEVQAAARAPLAVDGFETPLLNFAGQGYTGANPPDTVGDVGPNHYIQMVNASGGARFTIYDKSGSSVTGPTSLDTLGTGACADGAGDPIVLYDRLADRWLLTEFSGASDNLCVYVSQTPDPTGAYYAYNFATPDFPDYPKYAVWPDAYYISTNESSPAAYALDRTAMILGNPATSQRFTAPSLAGFGFQGLIPSDLDGASPPPAGSPNYFMRHRDDEVHNAGLNNPTEDYLEIWEFDVDFAVPGNSTFALATTLPIAEFDSDLCGLVSFNCFPQPGGFSPTLDPLREVIMWRLQYRNFGTHETLVGNFVTDVDGTDHGGIRWFELRKSGPGSWTLYQEGTYAPDADHRWMGSIAMDGTGNIALGYSVSSGTTYPSIRYAGRLAADTLGTLPQGEYSLVSGTAANASNRWGDYSSMNVDPDDDCTFWFTHMYNTSSSWSTRIGTFKFDACGAPDFTLVVDPTTQDVCIPADADYDIQIGQVQSYTDPVTLSTAGTPAGASSSFSVNPVTPPGASVLTLGTASAAPGAYLFDVIGTAPTSTHTATVGLNLYDAVPAAATLLTPLDGAVNVPLPAAFNWSGGGSSYTIEIATDPGFTNLIDSATVGSPGYSSTSLAIGTTYFWRVHSENACGAGPLSEVRSFTTQFAPGECGPGTSANILYQEGFESGAGGWTHSGISNTWTLSSANPHSGSTAFHADNIATVSDQRLVSPAIPLPTGENPLTLQFWNYQELEDAGAGSCYDGGILEISTNGGATWTQVPNPDLLTDPYDGPVSTSWSNPLGGLEAWCGDPQAYLNSIVDLSAYAGQTVNFRFRLGTDSSVPHPGWDIDDVVVQSCAPGPAIAVDPDSVTSIQPPDIQVTHSLTVSNPGISDLSWSVIEGACGAPGDISWVSLDPITGTTAGGFATLLEVTTDSNGLSSGDYISALCVDSNALNAPLVDIPVTMTVTSLSGVTLSPDMAQDGVQGTSVVYTLAITNTGSIPDVYDLAISGNLWPASLSQPTAALNPGEALTFTVSVEIPLFAPNGSLDTATITATSQADGSVSDSTELMTTVAGIEAFLFLPVVQKE